MFGTGREWETFRFRFKDVLIRCSSLRFYVYLISCTRCMLTHSIAQYVRSSFWHVPFVLIFLSLLPPGKQQKAKDVFMHTKFFVFLTKLNFFHNWNTFFGTFWLNVCIFRLGLMSMKLGQLHKNSYSIPFRHGKHLEDCGYERSKVKSMLLFLNDRNKSSFVSYVNYSVLVCLRMCTWSLNPIFAFLSNLIVVLHLFAPFWEPRRQWKEMKIIIYCSTFAKREKKFRL